MVLLANDMFVIFANDVCGRDIQSRAKVVIDRLDCPVWCKARDDVRILECLHFAFQNIQLGIFSLEPSHYHIRA